MRDPSHELSFENTKMNRYLKSVGSKGENIAEQFLVKHGMEILCRNYTIRGGELDIVARDGDCTVFVEVKTRTNKRFGSGLEAVTPKKWLALLRTAEAYAAENNLFDTPMRFDVLDIFLCGDGNTKIEYIKNAESNVQK